MQKPDDTKRRAILEVAARLFASKPFHEVRLEDVAAAASLGKGTLYVYFASKEELYLSLVREGFAEMVEHARREAAAGAGTSWDRLRSIVRGLIAFGMRYPNLYRVMRSGSLTPEDAHLLKTRSDLTSMIECAILDGIRSGEIVDDQPLLTAQFVPAFVRGALLYPPASLTAEVLEEQIMKVLRSGVGGAGGGKGGVA